MNISLITPTKNRPEFVQRLLTYLKEVCFTGCICIGDSSEGPRLVQTQKIIESAKDQLKIVYAEYPNLSNSHTIAEMVDSVSTDYAVLLPDDDFLVPESLQKCIAFLDSNPDYSAAHGKGVMINVDGRVHGPLTVSGSYNIHSEEDDSSTARIESHLGDFSVNLFSVHRTASWREMYKDVPKIKDAAFADEILPTSHAVANGKIKGLDCLYLIRHVHAGRYQHLENYRWITSPDWHESYEIFLNSVSASLVRNEGVGLDSARDAVKQGFREYLSKVLHRRWYTKHPVPLGIRSRIKGFARGLPFLKSGWDQARSFLPGHDNETTIQALLRPSSRYHADFMPVYKTVTRRSE